MEQKHAGLLTQVGAETSWCCCALLRCQLASELLAILMKATNWPHLPATHAGLLLGCWLIPQAAPLPP